MKVPNAHTVPLRRRARYVVRRLGLDVHRFEPSRDVDLRRVRFLRHLGVDVFVDGGANVGRWAQGLRRCCYRGTIISFEPLAAPFAALAAAAAGDPSWRCIRAALGDTDTTAEMNVAGNTVSSSLLPMETTHLRAARESAYLATESVRIVRLDTALPGLVAAGSRLGLKLDLQGYEAAAIAGMAGIFADVQFLECELSTVSLYRGQVLYLALMELLSDFGFGLVSLEEGLIDRATGRALQMNGMFVRRDGPLSPANGASG